MKRIILSLFLTSAMAVNWKNYTVLHREGVALTSLKTGQKLLTLTKDKGSEYIRESGEFDAVMGLLFRHIVQPGFVCLDIGAHYGQITMELEEAIGESGWVYAVEPGPQTAGLISETLELNGLKRHTLDKFAITSTTGIVRFDENIEVTIGAKVVTEVIPGAIEVMGYSLDDYLSLRQVEKLDFIRVDNEGSECIAFRGGKNAFKNNP